MMIITANESFIKPDAVRTFSCPITTCELSSNKLFLAVGLENGIFVLVDVISGNIFFVSICSFIHTNNLLNDSKGFKARKRKI